MPSCVMPSCPLHLTMSRALVPLMMSFGTKTPHNVTVGKKSALIEKRHATLYYWKSPIRSHSRRRSTFHSARQPLLQQAHQLAYFLVREFFFQ